MASYEFLAARGVRFPADGVHFVRAQDADTADGSKRYRYVTDDPVIARRLRKISDHGITEVKTSRERDNDSQ